MENLITLVNKIQRACTALGDHGEGSALPTLWDSLPAIAVVGGQVRSRSPLHLLILNTELLSHFFFPVFLIAYLQLHFIIKQHLVTPVLDPSFHLSFSFYPLIFLVEPELVIYV